MIVQTKRRNGFGAVLNGAQFTVTTDHEFITLESWGIKEQTGEPYVFRVLLTYAEWSVVRQAKAKP